jgi:hypothetical protein
MKQIKNDEGIDNATDKEVDEFFDKKKESVETQAFSIASTSEQEGKTCKYTMYKNVLAGDASYYVPDIHMPLKVGTKENAKAAAIKVANFQYTLKNNYLSDLGSGVYTMATTSQQYKLYDCQEIISRPPGSKAKRDEKKVAIEVILSKQAAYKAAFGLFVNDKGKPRFSEAVSIVNEGKRILNRFLSGRSLIPSALACIRRPAILNEDGKIVQNARKLIIDYPPIYIKRLHYTNETVYVIGLNYYFYPFTIKRNSFKSKGGFIYKPAGLIAHFQAGHKLINKKIKTPIINANIAINIFTFFQLAYQLGNNFFNGVVKKNDQGQTILNISKTAIPNLYPSAAVKTSKLKDYSVIATRNKKFAEAVSLTAEYFKAADKRTGFSKKIKQLKMKNEIFRPALNKPVEYPANYPNAVHIKKADDL